MLALGFLIVGDAGPAAVPVHLIGEIGLWIAGILTAITGFVVLATRSGRGPRAGDGSDTATTETPADAGTGADRPA
jgi:hypothetical protein